MGTNGYATVTLVDNGGTSVVVPTQSVQLVIGCSSTGTVGTIVSTRNATTLNTIFGWGPLVEAAGLVCAAGGTVLACRATTTTPGAQTAVTHTGTGVSVMTVTGNAFGTYFVSVLVMANATIATGPTLIQVSLDAGRTYSPTINLGTAATFAIPGTGMTLNFTTASVVAGDTYVFSSVEPLWNDAGILAALNAFQASPYSQQGFGSVHIVGTSAGADATAFGGDLEAWAASVAPLYSQVILSARDAHAPTAWGGSGETESTWMTALLTDFSAVAQKRVAVCAAYYNIPSALTNPLGMVPRFRQSIAYSVAALTTTLTPNRSWGRVKNGALPFVVISPTTDPYDGFIYHNESINPGLNAGRFATTTTRSQKQGTYILQSNNMASTGAQINSWPLISVASVAESILQQEGSNLINDDVRLLKSGVMDPRDVSTAQSGIQSAINANMTSQQMISSGAVVVDGSANLLANDGQLPVSCTLVARQVILQVNVTLQYQNPNQS